MPRIDPAKVEAKDLYGVQEVENNLTMGERIRKRFKPHDTVQVLNIDDESIEWQWLNPDDETYVIDDAHVKSVSRELPGLWRLAPGETDVLEGACAYIMIEALFKKMAVKKTGVNEHPLDEREIKNFSFDDPEAQEQIIDRIFRGKMTPHAMQQAAQAQISGKPKLSEPEPEDERSPKSKPKASAVSE